MNYVAALQSARLQAVIDAIGSAGKFLVCAARDPGDLTVHGPVLCEIVLASPCGTVAANLLTFTVPRAGVANVASATVAVEGVLKTSANVLVADDITIGEEGSGAEAIISESTIDDEKVVTLTSFTLQHP